VLIFETKGNNTNTTGTELVNPKSAAT